MLTDLINFVVNIEDLTLHVNNVVSSEVVQLPPSGGNSLLVSVWMTSIGVDTKTVGLVVVKNNSL
jgi:hypothetical protein